MATKLELVLDSLDLLNRRLDRLQAKEDAARADSEAAARRARREADYQGRISRQSAFSSLQARIDSILQPYGLRAPPPGTGQSARNYRLQLLELQAQLPPNSEKQVDLGNGGTAKISELAQFPLSRCDDNVVDIIGPQIEAAARAMQFDAESVPVGQIKSRQRQGGNGHSLTEFVGQRSFIDDLKAVNRRAKIADPFRLGMISRGFPLGDL